jgi:hypothetical protein
MLYAGLDLSRKRLDFHLLDAEGATVDVGASPPDADGLRGLSERLKRHGEPIRAAITAKPNAWSRPDQNQFGDDVVDRSRGVDLVRAMSPSAPIPQGVVGSPRLEAAIPRRRTFA